MPRRGLLLLLLLIAAAFECAETGVAMSATLRSTTTHDHCQHNACNQSG
ncbi:Uncharacterised protein [Mycobacteroides abscessus subsp. abscessus]|nr:Uncharacterised protein [Mycobacteroides abscessus subsp. abscessus]